MRNILFVGLACAVLAGQGAAAEKVVLEADDDYAPYSYVEKGQHKGIYVDFLKKVAEKLAPAYEVSLQPVPWKRGLQNLEKGESLALFPPYFNKERKFIQPYSTPLFRETVVLFCTDEVMKTPRKNFPDDFAGLTIGINLGFALGEKMVSAAKSGKIKTEEVKGNEANIKKLNAGRIGCYANDRMSVIHSAKGLRSDPEFKNFKLHEAVELSGEDAFIGYSAANSASYKADFIAKMNAAIEDAKKAGVLTKLIADYSK